MKRSLAALSLILVLCVLLCALFACDTSQTENPAPSGAPSGSPNGSENSSGTESPSGSEKPSGTESPSGSEDPSGTESPSGSEDPSGSESTHTHTYNLLKYDSENHWYECDCGLTDCESPHSGGTATCTKKARCLICNQEYGALKPHEYSDIYTSDDGNHWRKCKDCTAITDNAPHSYTSDKCVCGKTNPTPAPSESAYTREGDTIYFGSYPQTKVTDSSLVSTLNASAGALPTSSNPASWTSYGYYIEGSVQNYMWYIDVANGGDRYRGVYFTSYRPYLTLSSSSASNTYQDENGYATGRVYWFKWESISWSVISESGDTAFILCDMIVDAQEYYSFLDTRTVSGATVYPNNYEYSAVRAWLNDNFYSDAFNTLQKQIVITTTVDNSVASTESATNSHVCNNTSDKVFLLSKRELATNNITLAKNTTDYARAQGVSMTTDVSKFGQGDWWLRSPHYREYYLVSTVTYSGSVADNDGGIYATSFGVVPALRIRLEASGGGAEHTHSYNELNYDSASHWYECSCGVINGESAHGGGTATCTQKARCLICNQEYGAIKPHDYVTTYTRDDNNHWRKCNDCTDTTDYGVHSYTDGLCVCGKIDPSIGDVYTRVGNTVYFGSYPQSGVLDPELISTLDEIAGTLPTSSNSASWTSYGYYISGSVQNYMWYIDTVSGGERYRGVYLTSYRPSWTTSASSEQSSQQDNNGYDPNKIYWFKYEPIAWTVLKESSGEALILCDMIIDGQEYYINKDSRTVGGVSVNPNNYEYSTVRAWLNDTFYNTAFTALQRSIILTTIVDNSLSSTGVSSNSYVCNNTSDKVFLLSGSEVLNTAYGFSSSTPEDTKREKYTTDYAKSQGAFTSGTGKGYWWCRTPDHKYNYSALYIESDGSFWYGEARSTTGGIAPALRIKL